MLTHKALFGLARKREVPEEHSLDEKRCLEEGVAFQSGRWPAVLTISRSPLAQLTVALFKRLAMMGRVRNLDA